MGSIIDPGANAKTREEAKALRKAAWKRPTTKAKREASRKERIKAVIGDGNADIQE